MSITPLVDRLGSVLGALGALCAGLLIAVMLCGIAFQVFNDGDVPQAAWIVMSIAAGIGFGIPFAIGAGLIIVSFVKQLGDWRYFRRWFKE